MLRPDDLVGLDDFTLGNLTVSPSRRSVVSGDRSLAVEPRVMQVLVLLARAKGEVVTRQHLFDQVWGGVPVGEDSLNRAVGGVRKAIALDPDNLELETIPRTGYRLWQAGASAAAGVDRRAVVGGAAALVLAGAGGAWWYRGNRAHSAYEEAMRRGRELLAYGDQSPQTATHFARAAELRPDDPAALGLLALTRAMRAEIAQGAEASSAVKGALEAKQAALRLDPGEPHARLAKIILDRPLLDFAATEDQLNAVLRDHPRNTDAMRLLWNLKQCVGRSAEALQLVERATSVAPMAAANHYPRAQLLWILGRTAEADRVVDRALQYWPDHRWVRFARFMILAFSGRVAAAQAMLDSPAQRPQHYSAETVALWRANLPALDRPTPANIAAAKAASLAAARRNLQLASPGVMTLATLGEIDSAFDIANALFAVGSSDRSRAKGTAWRFAPWLFTPPLAALRADPRFEAVCDAAGLTDYWAKRGVEPDYRRSA
ncbi:winged helix-turn-helix domain-containing protein [Sphingomonas mesophila]|uniref:winged helix-turn-helix domain-containing protein n=1 Tax=Sphingomonas mesophila TaxID=2303576 RepID=UPI000E57A003|nr:winged helix-turn-helix domain-containing protein [Sphingomonas mesophila]